MISTQTQKIDQGLAPPLNGRGTFWITTFGCQMNKADSERMAGILRDRMLFNMTEEEWDEKTKGSAIRRSGYQGWLRNIAVALGNSEKEIETVNLLKSKKGKVSSMLDEHIDWAVQQQLSD